MLNKFFAMLLVAAAPSITLAAIYKCETEGGTTTYQALPCREAGGSLALDFHAPSVEEGRLVQEQLRRARGLVQDYEDERARNKIAADRDRRDKAVVNAARDARCAQYASELAASHRYERAGRKRTESRDERLRRLDAKYFSECVGGP